MGTSCIGCCCTPTRAAPRGPPDLDARLAVEIADSGSIQRLELAQPRPVQVVDPLAQGERLQSAALGELLHREPGLVGGPVLIVPSRQ